MCPWPEADQTPRSGHAWGSTTDPWTNHRTEGVSRSSKALPYIDRRVRFTSCEREWVDSRPPKRTSITRSSQQVTVLRVVEGLNPHLRRSIRRLPRSFPSRPTLPSFLRKISDYDITAALAGPTFRPFSVLLIGLSLIRFGIQHEQPDERRGCNTVNCVTFIDCVNTIRFLILNENSTWIRRLKIKRSFLISSSVNIDL